MEDKSMYKPTQNAEDALVVLTTIVPAMESGATISTGKGDIRLEGQDAADLMQFMELRLKARLGLEHASSVEGGVMARSAGDVSGAVRRAEERVHATSWEHLSSLGNTKGYMVVSIDNTTTGAFVETGARQEIMRILREAAADVKDPATFKAMSEKGEALHLRDLDGNRVGEAAFKDQITGEVTKPGETRVVVAIDEAADPAQTQHGVWRGLAMASRDIVNGHSSGAWMEDGGQFVTVFQVDDSPRLESNRTVDKNNEADNSVGMI